MNHSSKCLNCDYEINHNYCSNCGQKTAIHRITFNHFVSHDLLHGLFHLEKGMLYTAKEVLTRPGKAALDYIEGKRIRYYNVFYFILILIGVNLFLSGYYDKFYEYYISKFPEHVSIIQTKLDKFMNDNAKIIIFSIVPVLALNGFILFRKRKLNLSEHFIIAAFTFLGILLIVTANNILSFFAFVKHLDFISDVSDFVSIIAIFTLATISYYQTFKEFYKKRSFVIRVFMFATLLMIELLVFAIFLIGYSTNWFTSDFTY
jgi:hypothetical protein